MTFFDSLRKQKFLCFALVLFTLAIGILIGTVLSTGVKAAKDQVAAPGATPLVIPNPVALQNSFSTIAKQVEPSVVNISTTYSPKPSSRARNNGGKRQQVVAEVVIDLVVEVEDLRLLERPRLGLVAEDFARAA